MKNPVWKFTFALGGILALSASADEKPSLDFGKMTQKYLEANALGLFGFKASLAAPASGITAPYRKVYQDASEQILLAKGLRAEYVTRGAANAFDMMALWPNTGKPVYLVGCVEGGREVIGKLPSGADKYNPSVQRIHLKTGKVETLLRGMNGCDGVRATAWGTFIASEEEDDGGVYEILDPVGTTNQTVTDRSSGVIVDSEGKPSTTIAKRTALPTMAWEGIGLLNSGVIIAGDELRPGTAKANVDGGAIFKFIPTTPWTGKAPIRNLSESPLVAGKTYALQISCVNNKQQYGQGCEIGNGAWIEIRSAYARGDADLAGATGYYRPEDLHQDPIFADSANPKAVRVCWTNTGNETAKNFAEVMCAIDADPLTGDASKRTVVANRFVEGDSRFNSFDNLDFQPGTGNLYVIEDHEYGEIFACLPDGADRDIKTDGCLAMASVVDPSAEPTGFLFSPDGKSAYVSIQHSDDTTMPKSDDYGTDDIIKISGFQIFRK